MRFRLPLLCLIAATVALASGCVYPRRSTSLSTVPAARASRMGAPADVWQLTFVEAHVRPRKSGDLSWDEEEGLPDVYVRFMRDGEVIFETQTVADSLNPQWNESPEHNIRLSSQSQVRIEVWDRDLVGGDPVGIYNQRGLPDMAIEGAEARILLEGGSWLTIRRSAPQPHRGLGISQYELRPDRLIVVEVMPYSPASRAGLEAGDAITAIGEQTVADLNNGQAASALSMSATRHSSITYERGTRTETVELDRGFVWQTR